MGASKLEKQKQKLIELGVMEPEDTLVDFRNAGRQYCYSLQDDPRTGRMFPEPDADWHYDHT